MDQDFHDRFNGWEVQPPMNAWDKIERRLDGKNDKKPFFWWFTGIALFVILATGGVWFLSADKSIQVPEHISSIDKSENTSVKSEVEKSPASNSASTNSINAGDKNQSKPIMVAKRDSAITDINKGNLANNEKNNSGSKKVTHENTIKTSGNAPVYMAANSPAIRKKTTSTIPNNIDVQATSSSSKPIEQKEIATKANRDNTVQTAIIEQQQTLSVKADSTSNKQTKEIATGKDSASATDSLTSVSVPSTVHNQPIITAKLKNTDSTVVKENQVDTATKPMTDSTLLVKKDSVSQQNKIPSQDTTAKPNSAINSPKDTAKTKKPGAHLLSLSIYGSPEIGNNALSTNNTIFDIKSEKNNLQFAGGLRASFKLGSRIEISIAAVYSEASINYQSNQGLYFDRYTTQPYIFSSSYGDMSVPQATMLQGFSPLAPPSLTQFMLHGYQYSQTIQFMNIPINFRFNITTGKFKTYAAIGMNIQYAIGEKAEVDLIKELETDAIKYNSLNATKLNYAPTVAIGAEYGFAKHFGVFLEPNARYNLLSSSTNTSVKSNASFIGCALGLRVNL